MWLYVLYLHSQHGSRRHKLLLILRLAQRRHPPHLDAANLDEARAGGAAELVRRRQKRRAVPAAICVRQHHTRRQHDLAAGAVHLREDDAALLTGGL